MVAPVLDFRTQTKEHSQTLRLSDSQTQWWSTVCGNFTIFNRESQELIQFSIWTLQTNLCLKIIFSSGGSCTGLWIWGQ